MLLTRRHLLGGLGAAASLPLLPRAAASTSKPYVHFCINVHDWGHAGDSAAQIVKLAALFKKNGIKGDFFVNAFMVDRYSAGHADAVSALKGQTVSYSIRPPHPLYNGFGAPLKGLEGEALEAAIRDYETYAIDQSTVALDRTKPGGFTLSKQVFGRAPAAVTTLNSNKQLRTAAARVYKAMGAQVAVAFHEEESDPDNPWQTLEGLVVRPSHIGFVRYGGAEWQWWTEIAHDRGDKPLAELERRLGSWSHSGPPFVTALIHDNDFYRAGVESWALMYFTDEGKKTPKSAPYDLSLADPSRARKTEAKNRIWDAYEELVEWCAKNATCITSADLPAMAAKAAG